MSGLDGFSRETADWFDRTFGAPTKVQLEAWPAIMAGRHVLVSAPTGTGKTLSAFLVFIDRLMALAREGKLKEELYLIYVSPLKSLAGDIRENLKKPLEGISALGSWGESLSAGLEKSVPAGSGESRGADSPVRVFVRTGDTSQTERRQMLKHPPHILITTPESLYLLLTSGSGAEVLKTARAVILDELHALIDTKRGAHLMLSLARLDHLCGRPLQRIGLSATIEPLELAARYLAPEEALIVAPKMEKKVEIRVVGSFPEGGRNKDPIWEELAREIYEQCQGRRSVIAFCEGRRYAEKLAYYVNLLGGEGFARVHHGSLSKEQRQETEESLRGGGLRLLCATSSMELGIDVGEIDLVLQVGCPRTVSGTMQRLGRAGHNPGRVSLMYMYPRTVPEGLSCGMTAALAEEGGVEWAAPPRGCLDVLAQHLVSMAAGLGYSVDEVMEILARTYSFAEVSREDVKSVLAMLAGDYEHGREIPVRPRVLYDRIHELVHGDAYSRLLAVAAGGTIPDKGLYTARTEEGVVLGELDEEFVYETRIGDKILLGSFGWRVVRQDRDTVILAPAEASGARLPFWKGEIKGRSFRTGKAFGRIMRRLGGCLDLDSRQELLAQLSALGLDENAAEGAADFLERQAASTGLLPDDRTILVEHFRDANGCPQMMVHSLFGRRVNAPLSLLLQYEAQKEMGKNVGCVDEEDGFLLYSYGEDRLPEGLFGRIEMDLAREILEAMLPGTPVFSMTFRYNAARALMTGMKQKGRTPLWLQRLRSTELLDRLKEEKGHPLVRETVRECLEDLWDIQGVREIFQEIRSGRMTVREMWTETPSPMSLPLKWQVEAEQMYNYFPSSSGIVRSVEENLKELEALPRPSAQALEEQRRNVEERRRRPESPEQLHAFFLTEGDAEAEELAALGCPLEWLEELAAKGSAVYVEPGLWVAGEQVEDYRRMLEAALPGAREEDGAEGGEPGSLEENGSGDGGSGSREGRGADEAAEHILRRMLYYRGGQTFERIQERYCLEEDFLEKILGELCEKKEVVLAEGVYYHARLYRQAGKAVLQAMRRQAVTRPPQAYAAWMASLVETNASPLDQLRESLSQLQGSFFPAEAWEGILLPRRVRGYREGLLDQLLAEGEYFWKMREDGELAFYRYEDVDWQADVGLEMGEGGLTSAESQETGKGALTGADSWKVEKRASEIRLTETQQAVYRALRARGACFAQTLTALSPEKPVTETLMELACQGLVCADSFLPVRQWLNRSSLSRATARQRVGARVKQMSAGRWDVVHPRKAQALEDWLEQLFARKKILCRETYEKFPEGPAWGEALDVLRIWEYTGRVRRGYFVRGMSGAQFVRSQDYEGTVWALERYAGPQEAFSLEDGGKEAAFSGNGLQERDSLGTGPQGIAFSGNGLQEGRSLENGPREGDSLENALQEAAPLEDRIKWLNACDPALVWGKALSHQEDREFQRVPGTLVGLLDGLPVLALERYGRTLKLLGPEPSGELPSEVFRELLSALVRNFRGKKVFPGRNRLVVKEYPEGAPLKEAGFLREMQDYALYR